LAQQKKVCIIGGGIAGLSAAVFLTSRLPREKAKITLLEASPNLGGRAYSFFDKNINTYLDIGQHILASWYENTLEFLRIIGTTDKLYFQKKLEVNFADLNGKRYRLKCPKLPPPLHLIAGVFGYNALGLNDKLGILRITRAVKKNLYTDEHLKSINADELFKLTKQSERLVNRFWKPFIVAVFNAEPEETSAWLLVNMIKKGFLAKGNSNLILPKSNLNEIYVEGSVNYLTKNNAEIKCGTRIKEIQFTGDNAEYLTTERNEKSYFDYYISSVPFFEYANLTGDKASDNLLPSPIINIYHIFENNLDKILPESFIGILEGTIQWIFRTGKNSTCVVISSAKKLIDRDKDELINLSINEIYRALPEFKKLKIGYSRVIKEKRATFVPNADSMNSRPDNTTKYKNFFIAGDWTDTGYPSTLEGAVTSGRKCAEMILNAIN
jgi:hydroxysqualene dehydroxylase